MQESLITLAYIVASVLFIYGLKMLSSQKTARKGNMVSAIGMLIAVVATLIQQGMEYQYIIAGASVVSPVCSSAGRSIRDSTPIGPVKA
jgi:NAD(P) transhydrogenase subunit beta